MIKTLGICDGSQARLTELPSVSPDGAQGMSSLYGIVGL